jgi:hypothetical protein
MNQSKDMQDPTSRAPNQLCRVLSHIAASVARPCPGLEHQPWRIAFGPAARRLYSVAVGDPGIT